MRTLSRGSEHTGPSAEAFEGLAGPDRVHLRRELSPALGTPGGASRWAALITLLVLALSWGYPATTSGAAQGGAGATSREAGPKNGVAAAVSCSAYEPNDSLGTLYGPVAPGVELRAKLCTANDFDFYFIRAMSSRPLVINLTLPPALVNHVSLWVYNGQGTPLFGRHRITTATTTLRYTLPRNGKYIVGLYSPDHTVATGAAYLLKLGFLQQILPTPTRTSTRPAPSPTRTQPAPSPTRTQPAPSATRTQPPPSPTWTPIPTSTRTPLPTATPTQTPLPTYWLTIKGVYSGGSNGTFQVTHGVAFPISASESHPCGQEGFDRWVVTSGTAAIDSPTSPSTTVRVYGGNATVSTMYCGVVATSVQP